MCMAECARTIRTRQNSNRPAEPMDGLLEAKAQLKVPKMIIANSTPYIRLRPRALHYSSATIYHRNKMTYSASHPNTTMPIIIPALVAAFKAWLVVSGKTPLLPPKPFTTSSPLQKTMPKSIVIRLMENMSYESRRKPTPATNIARTSNVKRVSS